MHILIVKLGSIGDIVHTLPTLAAMRRAMPDAQISWVVEHKAAEILRGNSMLDNLIEIDTRHVLGKPLAETSKQIRDLRTFKFDVAIDFQGLWKSAFIAKISGAAKIWGFSTDTLREPSCRILLTDTVRPAPRTHVIKKNLELAGGALGIAVSEDKLEFPISTSSEHFAEAKSIVEKVGCDKFALLNPGGGWVTKLWPAANFGELADRLWETMGIASVIATGPNEEALSAQVIAASRTGRAVPARPSLKGFYELARRASVYVGGDTGPTHLAIAAETPVVGLFGPTEWWRNGSLNPDDICVERVDISCRTDCHRRTCSQWICMDTNTDIVYTAVSRRIALALGEAAIQQ